MAITPEYQTYLESEKWARLRERVLRRDKYLCQECRKCEATQVHHKTYKRIFNEPMRDLVSVCKICHKAIHARAKRKKRRVWGKGFKWQRI